MLTYATAPAKHGEGALWMIDLEAVDEGEGEEGSGGFRKHGSHAPTSAERETSGSQREQATVEQEMSRAMCSRPRVERSGRVRPPSGARRDGGLLRRGREVTSSDRARGQRTRTGGGPAWDAASHRPPDELERDMPITVKVLG